MTTITILPEKADSYRALAGDKESTGRTAGEALDALTSQLSDDEGGTLVIVQNYKPDEFFNAAQQERLTELMQLRQTHTLSSEEEEELQGLVEAELDGARRRAERKVAPPEAERAIGLELKPLGPEQIAEFAKAWGVPQNELEIIITKEIYRFLRKELPLPPKDEDT